MNKDSDILDQSSSIIYKTSLGAVNTETNQRLTPLDAAQQIDHIYRKHYRELLTLIQSDLRMRADEEGVVNISDFIWQRIKQELSDE